MLSSKINKFGIRKSAENIDYLLKSFGVSRSFSSSSNDIHIKFSPKEVNDLEGFLDYCCALPGLVGRYPDSTFLDTS